MVTFTANKALGLPAVGGDTGVWGGPLNTNSSILDASLGGSVTIPLSSVSGSLTLLASNYQNTFLTFTGALSQDTQVTLPAVGSFYTLQNLTTGNFDVQLIAGAGQVVGVPYVNPQDIFTDGSNVKLRGLPQIGTYWDYCGNAIPRWIFFCSVQPWLNCDGSTFSAVTYPRLNTILGGNTLPDSRGRVRAALNQGTGLLSIPINGDIVRSVGGNQLLQSHNHGVNDFGHGHTVTIGNQLGTPTGNGTTNNATNGIAGPDNLLVEGNTTGISIQTAGGGGSQNVQPTYIGGLTLIRAG